MDNTKRRILFAGDTHMNSKWWTAVFEQAVNQNCDTIVQVGDFGFFPTYINGQGDQRGLIYLGTIAIAAERLGITVIFIKGNHEDHDALDFVVENAPLTDENFVDVYPPYKSLLYAPNGMRWNWDGVEFGVLGGAFSVDWRGRTPGTDWFPGQEEPNEDDVANLGDEHIDVLITHDAPHGTKLTSGFNLGIGDENAADRARVLIKQAVRTTQPSLVVHGHWHQRRTQTLSWVSGKIQGQYDELPWDSCIVESLGKDGNLDSLWVLDTEDFKKAYLND
jgi:Icc-related predicted phosphoesterase